MKNRIIITCVLALIAGFACAQNKRLELKGAYGIGSFEINPNSDFHSIVTNGQLNVSFGDVPFNFIDNNTVIISRELGNRLFGGSTFKYKLTKHHLILTNKNKRIEVPYIYDGVFRIKVKDSCFSRLDLSPLKKKLKNNSL